MKLNVGCGKQTWDGFFCVDAVQHPKASRPIDLVYEFTFTPEGYLREMLPLDDGCVSELHNYHFIEHVHEWEAPAVINEFFRLLELGGRLVMELPDIEHACRNILKGKADQWGMWPLYGDGSHKDPYMCHKYGYTKKTMRRLLANAGFREIKFSEPLTHGRRKERDMRVEAIK